MEQRRCIHCRARFSPLRNFNQSYCSKSACQKKRRCKYQQMKLKQDNDYQANQRTAEKKWHCTHPGYWKQYRAKHPKQREANRIAQRARNQKRKKSTAKLGGKTVIATMYSLIYEKYYFS